MTPPAQGGEPMVLLGSEHGNAAAGFWRDVAGGGLGRTPPGSWPPYRHGLRAGLSFNVAAPGGGPGLARLLDAAAPEPPACPSCTAEAPFVSWTGVDTGGGTARDTWACRGCDHHWSTPMLAEEEAAGPVTFTFSGGTRVTVAADGTVITPAVEQAVMTRIVRLLNEECGGDWSAEGIPVLCRLAESLGVSTDTGLDGDDEDSQECGRCGDRVATLSSSNLCDGCEADPSPRRLAAEALDYAGRLAAAASAPLPDPLTAVCEALGEEARTAIETRFTAANPHWQGAPAADILEALYDHDAHLDVREPFAEANPGLTGPGAAYAELALIRLGRPLTAETVGALLTRAGLA